MGVGAHPRATSGTVAPDGPCPLRRRQVLLHQVVVLRPNQVRALCLAHICLLSLAYSGGELRDQFQLLMLLIAFSVFAHDGAWGDATRREMDGVVWLLLHERSMLEWRSADKGEVEFTAELGALVLAFGVLVPEQ